MSKQTHTRTLRSGPVFQLALGSALIMLAVAVVALQSRHGATPAPETVEQERSTRSASAESDTAAEHARMLNVESRANGLRDLLSSAHRPIAAGPLEAGPPQIGSPEVGPPQNVRAEDAGAARSAPLVQPNGWFQLADSPRRPWDGKPRVFIRTTDEYRMRSGAETH